jgi:lysophospholipase L1-like esterase
MPVAAKLIKETALANNCGVWDFFHVMGGRGSVKDWYSNQLVFKDGIHLSKKGYKYQGYLFFEAFIKLKDLEK